MAGPLPLEFVTSASAHTQLPESIVELAVVGRSNVGKSTLINALANRKSLAKTSKTPGATQLINVFEYAPKGSGKWLVDLPGYGFAKAPEHAREKWARMIEAYLTEREQLDSVLVLIDGAIGPTNLDLQSLEWFADIRMPITLVATKHDKVKPSKLGARKQDLAEKCGVDQSDVTWVSASKGTGIAELRSIVREILEVT